MSERRLAGLQYYYKKVGIDFVTHVGHLASHEMHAIHFTTRFYRRCFDLCSVTDK